jgi:hypothetical protein
MAISAPNVRRICLLNIGSDDEDVDSFKSSLQLLQSQLHYLHLGISGHQGMSFLYPYFAR